MLILLILVLMVPPLVAGGLLHTVGPEKLIWHDLLDAYSVNPHHRGNPFNAIAKLAVGSR